MRVGGEAEKKEAHRSRSGAERMRKRGQENRAEGRAGELTIYLTGGISGWEVEKEGKRYQAKHEAVDGSETLLAVDADSVF